eukprot:m.204065 g.204065  ORF g.204065 m.204065 type:complete len:55 (+) comp17083_c0_seq1:6708-6872(+)
MVPSNDATVQKHEDILCAYAHENLLSRRLGESINYLGGRHTTASQAPEEVQDLR